MHMYWPYMRYATCAHLHSPRRKGNDAWPMPRLSEMDERSRPTLLAGADATAMQLGQRPVAKGPTAAVAAAWWRQSFSWSLKASQGLHDMIYHITAIVYAGNVCKHEDVIGTRPILYPPETQGI